MVTLILAMFVQNKRFDDMNKRFDEIIRRLERIEARLDNHDPVSPYWRIALLVSESDQAAGY